MNLDGKTLTVAGKLAGRYASRRRELEARLSHLGAELLDGFHPADADVAVIGAKAKAFMKRVSKAGLATLTEAELEAAVEDAFDTPKPKPQPPDDFSAPDFARRLRELGKTPRATLVAELVKAADAHHDLGFAVESAASFGEGEQEAELLIWVGWSESELVVLPAQTPLAGDVELLSGHDFHAGSDCPLPRFGAGLRLLAAIGQDIDRTWEKLRGELEDRNGYAEAGVESVDDLRAVADLLAPHRIRRPEDVPVPTHLHIVFDHILW